MINNITHKFVMELSEHLRSIKKTLYDVLKDGTFDFVINNEEFLLADAYYFSKYLKLSGFKGTDEVINVIKDYFKYPHSINHINIKKLADLTEDLGKSLRTETQI